MAKKLLFMVTSFNFPHFGGLSRTMTTLIDSLSKKNFEVHVLSRKGNKGNSSDLKFDVITSNLPINGLLNGSLFYILYAFLQSLKLRFFAAKRADYLGVIAHDVYGGLTSIFAGQRSRTILHIHSIWSQDFFIMDRFESCDCFTKFLAITQSVLDRFIEIIVYNLIPIIICVSEYEETDAKRKTISKKKIAILRNPVNTEYFVPRVEDQAKLRRQLKIPEADYVFLFLGRMVPKNGPRIIAKSIPLVNEKIKAVFVFVGNGPELKSIIYYAHKLNLRNAIFLPSLPSEKILPIADIFLTHVSSKVAGHGNTVLEAMASGIPVLTGRDYIKDCVFADDEVQKVRKDSPEDLAQKLVSLSINEKKRKEMALKARKKVEEDFSLSVYIRKWAHILSLF